MRTAARPLTPAGERTDLRAVLEQRYAARSPQLTPLQESATKGIYRVDHASGEPWVLRHYPASRPLERLVSQASIMRHIERQGIPMERVVQTADGSETAELNGRGVLVTTLLEGRPPRRTPDVLQRLGETIGQIHALPAAPTGDPVLDRTARAMPREDLAGGRAHLDRIQGKVPIEHRPAYERLAAWLAETRDLENLPREACGLIHNDCHMANAIELVDGSVAWFDWDGVGRGPRIAALGILLYSCAVRYPDEHPEDAASVLDPPDLPAIAGRVEALLTGYLRHHRPSDVELEYLPDAARFRPLVVAAREFEASIEQGQPPNETGWWGRYADATTVATCARKVIARTRPFAARTT